MVSNTRPLVNAECPGCGKAYRTECDWCSDDIPKPDIKFNPYQLLTRINFNHAHNLQTEK